MKIGELASAAGVNIETIRYYERQRLLPAPHRTESGYRQFDSGTLARVGFIKHAQDLGFSLSEIKDLIRIQDSPAGDCSTVRDLALQKITDIDRKVNQLISMREMLERAASACPGSGPVAFCTILNAITGEEVKQR